MTVGLLARLDEESRARLLAEAFERSSIAKAVATAGGEIVEVNNAFCGLTGYRREELVGRPITILLPPGEPFQGFGDPECERRIVRRDGTRGWIATRALPVRGSAFVVLESVESDEQHALADRVAQSADEARGLRTTIAIQREVAAAAGDRDALVALAAERALQVLTAGDGAAVHLLDGETIPIVAAAGYVPPAQGGPPVPLDGTLAGLAVSTRSTLRSDDTDTDPRVAAELGRANGIRSLVIAPLLRPDGPIGVLSVIARRAHAFGEADEQQLTLLADALTGALRHAEDARRNRELLLEATEANAALARQRAAALAAVQRLEQSEGRFAEVFDHSPLAKVVLGLRGAEYGRIVLANPAFSELVQRDPVTVTGAEFADIVAVPRPDYDAALASLAAGQRHRSARETVLRRRDGALVSVAAHTSVISDQAGPAAAVVQLRDVTRERAAALALSRSEEQFRTAFSGSPLGLVLCDEADVFRQANPAAAALTGRTAGELAGLRYTDVTDPRDLATVTDARTGLRTGGQVQYDQRLLRPDGREAWVRVTVSVVPGPEGEPWRLMQLQDIAAERAAEMATEREHRRLQHTLSVQRELIAVAADRDAALHVVAERAVELFPAADGAAVELAEHEDLVYAATAGTLAGALGTRVRIAASLSGAVLSADATAHCRDAARDPRVDRAACERLGIGSMLIVPLHADDMVIGVLKVSSRHPHVFDDADEQQLALLAEALASALRHADDAAALATRNAELEEANRLKRDLIGMLGHELGNPLAAILGYTEIASDTWPTLGEGMRTKVLDGITRQAHRLDGIVQEVLTMVRSEAGTLHAKRARTPLHGQIALALANTGAHAGTGPEGVPVTGPDAAALVDAGQLQQILTNLLSNAAKYGGGATAIRVSPDGTRVRVAVEDRGPGVPPEFRDRLFERLARAERDAAKVRGTGLGLYIVRNLAQANNADVHYEPNPGGGSVFVIDLESA
ncbi:PAS domain S-box protein [Dactylosporangium sp. NPDC051541]|uniref:PAS domain S-box protein n=1 Tax=Dactylosporangium sp. NPDC051541 TaxID=3363977 RepID=UPI00379C8BF4